MGGGGAGGHKVYKGMGRLSRRHIRDIFLIFLFSRKNKKTIIKCRLLQLLPSMQSSGLKTASFTRAKPSSPVNPTLYSKTGIYRSIHYFFFYFYSET